MDSIAALQSITLGQQNCKVFGRLLRLWDAINVKSKFADPLISIDGVLLDDHGTRGQISVPKRFQKQLRPLLTEGYVYIFTDVAAVDIKNKTHVYHHQNYMLQFKHNTKVHQLETRGANIPKFSFMFCPFDKLAQMDTMARPPQVISHVGPFDYASPKSQNKLRIIKIRNLDEQTQEIRLWGEHGETFHEEAVLKKSQEGIVVGIFAGITTGSFMGTLTISSNSATKIYIDLDTSKVNNYQTRYKLPITLADDSGNLDAIAFCTVAEELVERDATHASQNMKIDPSEHVNALDNAIGKTKLFHIGMKVDSASRFPISYVIKKSYLVDNAQILPSIKASPGKELITNPSPITSVQSSTSNTPHDLPNTTPPFREPADITTNKN